MRSQISAIETEYRGRKFRSRLEAKWANFFTILGWRYEYEPFDLPGWIPDFIVGDRLLVEIKPFAMIEEWEDEIETISSAMGQSGREESVLLLGCYGPQVIDGYLSLGFLGEFTDYGHPFTDSAFGMSSVSGTLDVCHREGNFTEMVSGHYPGGSWPLDGAEATALAHRAWANAGNRTQWKPRVPCRAQ